MSKPTGTVIYPSFTDAIREGLAHKYRFEFVADLVAYGVTKEEPDLGKYPPNAELIWTLVKPQIDANVKRREGGGKRKTDEPVEEKEVTPMVSPKVPLKRKEKAKAKDKDKGLLLSQKTETADREAPDGGAPAPAELVTADESEKLLEELKNKRLIEQAALAAVKGARG